jgi:hypothetical protein
MQEATVNFILNAPDEAVLYTLRMCSVEDTMIFLCWAEDKRIVTKWFNNMSDGCRKLLVRDMEIGGITMYEGKEDDVAKRIVSTLAAGIVKVKKDGRKKKDKLGHGLNSGGTDKGSGNKEHAGTISQSPNWDGQ